MPIYKHENRQIQELFADVNNGTLLIPDIQREYVWTPDRVIQLIDSVLKGWPFGALLLWDTGVATNHNNIVPNHPFRKRIVMDTIADCPFGTDNFGAADVPNPIIMVLDGQQRLQSLLLAFGAHDSGMYLLDKNWFSSFDENQNHPYRGSQVNRRASFGAVYVDLQQLASYMQEVRGNWYLRSDVDWTKVFVWAIPSDSSDHSYPNLQDNGAKPEDYRWPIPCVWKKNNNPGSYSLIKASSFWGAAQGFGHIDEIQRIQSAEAFLTQSQSGNLFPNNPRILSATIKLLEILSNARSQNVQCLKLSNQVDAGFAYRDYEYAEAVVNIFNRLNASGVSLKHEEMVFAWVKTAWMQLPAPRPIEHSEIVSKIANTFNYKDLDEAQIIKALNVIWITAGDENEVALFSHQDILNGTRIRTMSSWMANNWSNIVLCFKDLSSLLIKNKVKYGSHYKSMNLLYISLAYLFVRRKVQCIKDTAPENNGFMEQVSSDLFKFWYLSLFSGRWARNSDADTLHFARQIKSIQNNEIGDQFNNELLSDEVREKVKSHILNFNAEDSYAANAPMLFLWTLSKGGRSIFYENLSTPSIDHIYSRALWNGLNVPEIYRNHVHMLGNLMEVGVVDNSSKNNSMLNAWLTHIDPVRHTYRRDKYQQIMNYFEIPSIMSGEVQFNNLEELISSIENRTLKMKNDIIRHLCGDPNN